jgi:hypothetical protein
MQGQIQDYRHNVRVLANQAISGITVLNRQEINDEYKRLQNILEGKIPADDANPHLTQCYANAITKASREREEKE